MRKLAVVMLLAGALLLGPADVVAAPTTDRTLPTLPTPGSIWRTGRTFWYGKNAHKTIVILRATAVDADRARVSFVRLEDGAVWRGYVGDVWLSHLVEVDCVLC